MPRASGKSGLQELDSSGRQGRRICERAETIQENVGSPATPGPPLPHGSDPWVLAMTIPSKRTMLYAARRPRIRSAAFSPIIADGA
jgi:hypothetical protein